MDIARLSMDMSQGRVQQQANLSVMKIAMNTGKETAAAMTEMLKSAVDPNLGQHLDIKA